MKAPKYISHDDVMKLATHTDSEPEHTFILTLYYTGARVSEILRLTVADVDLTNRTFTIVHSKRRRTAKSTKFSDKTNSKLNHIETPPTTPQPTTEKPRRRLPIAAPLVHRISSLLSGLSRPVPARGRRVRAQADSTTEDANHQGSLLFPFSRMTAFRLIREASMRSGIRTQEGKLVTPHCLRHSLAIAWIKKGGKIEQLQKFLGHADPKTTSIYLQFEPKDLADEQDRIFGATQT